MTAIHTGLGILLSVCAFLSSLSAHLRDIQPYQAVKGVLDDYDTLANLLELIEHFLNCPDIHQDSPLRYHTTILDPLGEMNLYFPTINEHISKQNKKVSVVLLSS